MASHWKIDSEKMFYVPTGTIGFVTMSWPVNEDMSIISGNGYSGDLNVFFYFMNGYYLKQILVAIKDLKIMKKIQY